MRFKSTAEISVPKRIIDQIIGQDHAVKIIKKAAKQRRNVLLIGEPGTGKSLLGQALAELLPKSNLVDVLCYPNPADENEPLIKIVPAGKGKQIIEQYKIKHFQSSKNQQWIYWLLAIVALLIPWWIRDLYGDIMAAASLIAGMMFVVALVASASLMMKKSSTQTPKLIVDNSNSLTAPFIDATGAHAGALLGDVLHDPFQSGGLGTPPHLRVQSGMIHRAHKGVLFIDEIATMSIQTQQNLLTAMQEKKFPITGQSEKSAGAMVRTKPVPCDFILVAAGNLETIRKMHPALRSRIRGYGYEVYMNDSMPDTPENRAKLARFVAQEVVKDGKIPHFSYDAVDEIIKEARKRSGRKDRLTLKLRDLGGLVRAAGDIALEEGAKIVRRKHVLDAKKIARTLEQQISDKYIEMKKEYEVIKTSGTEIGRVNGLAVIGAPGSWSGLILPIEAEVVPTGDGKSRFVATGKLGKIAQEAITNVSAIIKKLFKEDIKNYEVHVQFLQTYEGVEGDSASIAVAVAIISALRKIPVRQDTALTGSLSIRGEVLPVGGITPKIEAAIEAGMKQIIIPKANLNDIILPQSKLKKIKVIPVQSIQEVLHHAFRKSYKKKKQ